MLLSKLLGDRFKEKPTDAFLDSHIFLLRGGYIRSVSNGSFLLLPPAKRILDKISNIIKEEMDNLDGQEVLLPVILPAELYQESGRYDSTGSELLRFRDHNKRDMVLGMSHEEVAVNLARTEAKSYTKYPFMVYQIHTKFRDESQARGGLIRLREFTMKDAYSFHTDHEDLEDYYNKMLSAYSRIFERVGLSEVVISVKADTGMVGRQGHEFMYLSDNGDDTLAICDFCGYKANIEVATQRIERKCCEEEEMQEVYTPNAEDIETLTNFLGIKHSQTIKASVFVRADNNELIIAFIRGDFKVSESKLKNIVGGELLPFRDYGNSDISFGYIGACNLKVENAQIIYDKSLEGEKNLVCGANKVDYHIKGVSVSRDLDVKEYVDIAEVSEGDCCELCGQPLKIVKGIELGNTIQLGTKYTKAMNMTYTDKNGKQETPLMNFYGIGVERLLACILEANHDDYGAKWPKSVAPWQIHICVLNSNVQEINDMSIKIYKDLCKNYEVIMDDRNATTGVQFADADLIGAPVRIVISKKNHANGVVEVVKRDKSFNEKVEFNLLENVVSELINNL